MAILSRVGIDDVVAGFSDQAEDETTEARLLWATCGGVRVGSVYVPNGREVGSEHYDAKLAWLERLRRHVGTGRDPRRSWSAATSTSPPRTGTCGTPPSSTAAPT